MERLKSTLGFMHNVPNENHVIFDNVHNMGHVDLNGFSLKWFSKCRTHSQGGQISTYVEK